MNWPTVYGFGNERNMQIALSISIYDCTENSLSHITIIDTKWWNVMAPPVYYVHNIKRHNDHAESG